MRRIYLDYNGSSPCRPEVLARMAEVSEGIFGNPSSAHKEGRDARSVVEEARRRVATALGAEASEIVFTGGGTESDNLAILGVLEACSRKHPHVVSSRIEHDAVLKTCRTLEGKGVQVSLAGCGDQGVVDADEVGRLMGDETVLVSLMHANNETGCIQPIREIAQAARECGIPTHTDAVQSVGKIPVDVNVLGVDLLSISGHKIGGPKGVGALYVKKGTALRSIMHGGGHEWGLRPGTESVSAVAGLGIAITASVRGQAADAQRLRRLKSLLLEGLASSSEGMHVNGSLDHSTANTLNVSFDGLDGEALAIALDLEDVAVSTGSACAAGAAEPSHVLEAMCLGRNRCRGAIRFSMGFATTEEEITRALEIVPRVVRRLRSCTRGLLQ